MPLLSNSKTNLNKQRSLWEPQYQLCSTIYHALLIPQGSTHNQRRRNVGIRSECKDTLKPKVESHYRDEICHSYHSLKTNLNKQI